MNGAPAREDHDRAMPGRPWADKPIRVLEEMFDRSRDNPDVLETLFAELSNRNTVRARALKHRVVLAAGRLDENFRRRYGRPPRC